MRIGAQLYTVRDFTKDLESFSETLKRVADIGYEYVQVSGTCEYDGAWLAEELKKSGLKCPLTHYDRDQIRTNTDAVIAKHKEFGCDYIGIGWYDLKNRTVADFLEDFKDVSKKINDSGLALSYHNHDFEFGKAASGKTFLAEIVDAFTPEQLKFTLDTFWVQAGGGDPAWWINELKGRTPCVHFKDMSYDKRMEPVGYGNMNFDAIIKATIDAGVDYAFVEQDRCYEEDPFKCLEMSYNFLKSRGLN